MRSAALFLLAALSVRAADTPEAARVAPWVRALPAVEAEASFFGVLGGISTTHIGRLGRLERDAAQRRREELRGVASAAQRNHDRQFAYTV
jgi:hypothetical protein